MLICVRLSPTVASQLEITECLRWGRLMRKVAWGSSVSTALGFAVVSAFADGAGAAGFGLREGSTDWLSNAFAGTTAKAYDSSTAFANPAGMVRLDMNEIDASINAILPSSNFSGRTLAPWAASHPAHRVAI